MAETKTAPASEKPTKGKGKQGSEPEEQGPDRNELIKDALSRAGMSVDLAGYDDEQLDRAASVSPQRRGKALREFIMSGPKDSATAAPRETRQINWDTPFKKGDSPGYLVLVRRPGAKNFELVGTHQGTGIEGEKNMAKLLGVEFPNGLRELVEKGEILSMNARYANLSDGPTQTQATTATTEKEASAK